METQRSFESLLEEITADIDKTRERLVTIWWVRLTFFDFYFVI